MFRRLLEKLRGGKGPEPTRLLNNNDGGTNTIGGLDSAPEQSLTSAYSYFLQEFKDRIRTTDFQQAIELWESVKGSFATESDGFGHAEKRNFRSELIKLKKDLLTHTTKQILIINTSLTELAYGSKEKNEDINSLKELFSNIQNALMTDDQRNLLLSCLPAAPIDFEITLSQLKTNRPKELAELLNTTVRKDGATLLHIAVELDSVKMYQLLKDNGMELDVIDGNGNTALHVRPSQDSTKQSQVASLIAKDRTELLGGVNLDGLKPPTYLSAQYQQASGNTASQKKAIQFGL